jgi:hypothetical protein
LQQRLMWLFFFQLGKTVAFRLGSCYIKKKIGAIPNKEQNNEWLREKFANLKALWIMVVDGQIKAWEKIMKDYPQPEQIMEICRNTGKYPFIFIDDDRMAIEESAVQKS